MKKIFATISLLFVINVQAFAVSAYPMPIDFKQPQGDVVTVLIKGDERSHWHETMDGYTLLFNQDGYLTYALLDEAGNLQPSDFIATNIEKRDNTAKAFLKTLGKKLFYSDAQKQLMRQVWKIEDEAKTRGNRALTGLTKVLCAFVQFSEKSMIKTMTQFDGLMNQIGYMGNGAGSVRDYFKESSYNQFDIQMTLCGIYTAPKSESYYAGPPGDGTLNCPELAEWLAQRVAVEPGIDFRDYDGDGDGFVDAFHFIFAGEGQEAGGGPTTIWSHQWSFSPPVVQNGKRLNIYSCSPELLNSDITTVGVICHEMSHVFGSPDFYDTDDNQFEGTGNWDIMAGGSWNNNGNRPAHHNMYQKTQFGWVNPVILSTPTTVTDMPNSAQNAVAYRINTNTPNEYYLLENRQKVRFDTDVPGSGLLIYHVHSNVGTSCINCTHPQRLYPVCANRTTQMPTETPSSYGNINSAGCPFPGTSNKTSFTDETTPAMKSWTNNNTGKPITNITHSNKLISFDFMGGGTGSTYTITATTGEHGTITPTGVITVFAGGSRTYSIIPDEHYAIATVLINGTNDPTAVTTGTYNFSNVNFNQTIEATFTPKTHIATLNADNYSPIQIVPNPASNYIDLQFTIYNLQFEHIEFYNAFGQLVKNVSIHGESKDNTMTQKISIADLPKGIYVIRIENQTAKLVVH
jgi:M6 family metalloprotease-like protein